jgi:hypothetical protein
VVRHAQHRQQRRAGKGGHADVGLATSTAIITREDPRDGDPVARVEAGVAVRRGVALVGASEETPAAEGQVSGKRDCGVRGEVGGVGPQLVPGRSILFIRLLTMMPVGATGESDPACAPMPTMMAMRNGEMPAR